MGNYVLTLHHERCPDGAELVPHPCVSGTVLTFPAEAKKAKIKDGFAMVRFRTDRREDYRRRLEAPDKLIVTEFINTCGSLPTDDTQDFQCDYSGLINFVSEYGFPFDNVRFITKLRRDVKWFKERGIEDYDKDVYTVKQEAWLPILISWRDALREIWQAYESGDVRKAVELFREAKEAQAGLSPELELRYGRPALTLPTDDLYVFMLMETALVISGGSQVTRCAECGTIFVTGSGTGRRGSSLYCTNRCRVAAQRSRKDTPASPEDAMTVEEKLQNIAAAVRGTVRD